MKRLNIEGVEIPLGIRKLSMLDDFATLVRKVVVCKFCNGSGLLNDEYICKNCDGEGHFLPYGLMSEFQKMNLNMGRTNKNKKEPHIYIYDQDSKEWCYYTKIEGKPTDVPRCYKITHFTQDDYKNIKTLIEYAAWGDTIRIIRTIKEGIFFVRHFNLSKEEFMPYEDVAKTFRSVNELGITSSLYKK